MSNSQIYREIMYISCCQGLEERKWGLTTNEYRFPLGDKNVFESDNCDGYTTNYKYTKNHRIVQFNMVNCMVSELYLTYKVKTVKDRIRVDTH